MKITIDDWNGIFDTGTSGKLVVHQHTLNGSVLKNILFSVVTPRRKDVLYGFSKDQNGKISFLEPHHDDWLDVGLSGLDTKVENFDGVFKLFDIGTYKVVGMSNDGLIFKMSGKKQIDGYYVFGQKDGVLSFEIKPSQTLDDLISFVKPDPKFHEWKTDKPISGSLQDKINEVGKQHNIDYKYVTCSYACDDTFEKLFKNGEIVTSVQSDSGSYKNFHVKSEKYESFYFDEYGKYTNQLITFFNAYEDVKDLLNFIPDVPGEEFVDYPTGSYELKETMSGFVLIPFDVKISEEPIFDEDVVSNLHHDTKVFFDKREFYLSNNLPHKRGILLYGPPGNGKTTFIRSYVASQNENYNIFIDASGYVPKCAYDFLDKVLSDKRKILIFEDVDSICYSGRSAFLNMLDGVKIMDNTLVIGTTNYPERLDDALLKRPSRFDRLYKIQYPNESMCKKFLQRWFPFLQEPLLTQYASRCVGFSGAHFKELFTLKNIQDITIGESIDLLRRQINIASEIRKNLVSFNVENVVEKNVNVFKATKTTDDDKKEDEKIVFGEVLVPNEVDAHGDTYTEKTVELASYYYMENQKKQIGSNHRDMITKGVVLLESYVAPSKMTIKASDGTVRKIKKGTWMMKLKVVDDTIWEKIKKGDYKGFSIGGVANVREIVKMLEIIQKNIWS